jgi:uncharacterized protein (TIGR01370 family)
MYSNFVLQFGSVSPTVIAGLNTGLLITEGDPLRVGNANAAVTDAQVATLKTGGTAVLGYVNASVTDDTRPYWNAAWTDNGLDTGTPTSAAPSWLQISQGLDFDPAKPGVDARIVNFADAQWQALVINQALDLQARGYSGIFLDDVGQYFGANAIGGTAVTRAVTMVDFITSIRAALGPNFQIFTNGDPYLGTNASKNQALIDAIDGMLLESYLRNDTPAQREINLNHAATFIAPGAQLVALEYRLPNDTQVTREALFDYHKSLDAKGVISFFSDAVVNANGTDSYSSSGVTGGTPTALSDVLFGNGANNTIFGLAGDDKIAGYDGNDVLVGMAGNDDILGGNGNDYLYGGDGADLLQGSDGFDILLGEGGDDTLNDFGGSFAYLFGGVGNNLMQATAQVNVFNSEGSQDTMSGTNASFYYRLANGASTVTGGAGVDQFIGGPALSNDSVTGGAGTDYLYGGAGNDVLRGGADNDVILGQTGNDTLEGGSGVNLLWANDAGNDQILVNIADGGTQVVEFFEAGGTNDVVRLLGSSLTSFAGYEALRANIGGVVGSNLLVNAGSGAQLYLNLGANQTAIWFQGVSAYSLTSADFLFV